MARLHRVTGAFSFRRTSRSRALLFRGMLRPKEWVSLSRPIVDVGLEGDAIDDSEAEDAGVEGVAGHDGPMLKLIVGANAPLARKVIVKADAGRPHVGVVSRVVGIGWVGECDDAVAHYVIDVGDEAFDSVFEAEASAEGSFADGVAGSECEAGLDGEGKVSGKHVGVVAAEGDAVVQRGVAVVGVDQRVCAEDGVLSVL